jgi:hypothetical protein
MDGVATKPEGLPGIPDFEVGELHFETFVTGRVEEHLPAELVAG